MNEQASRLSDLQSGLVADLSHQLRTPLGMIAAAAETLGLDHVRSPERVREYAELVTAQARRLSRLVDQILYVHRARFAPTGSGDQPVDLGELVARAVGQLQALSDRSSVVWHVECDEPPVVVRGAENAVWGYSTAPMTRTVDNFVAKVRKKIEDDPREPRHILTVHGSGYRFVP